MPTTNMSKPERKTPRPVKMERAAPTRKWESMATEKEMRMAPRPTAKKKGSTGMIAPTAVATPVVQPSRSGELVRLPLGHALELVDQRQFVALDLGHQLDLGALHADLVDVDLLLALGGQVAAGAHRQGVGDEAGDPGHDHRPLLRRCGADDSGHQAEVRGQAVVEAVHDV